MTEKDYLIAREFKEKVSEILKLLDFRVFGSRAKGITGEDSDMDVYIKVDYLDKDLEKKVNYAAWEVGYNNYVFISPLIFTKEEAENSALRSSDIMRNINEEGIRI